jgi:hypothetical protein
MIESKDYLNQIEMWLLTGKITPQQLDELARKQYELEQRQDHATRES